MANTMDASKIGEKSVLHWLMLQCWNKKAEHMFMVVPGSKEEHFTDADKQILCRLYPDCESMGSLAYPDMAGFDGFAKLIQEYGCDILETWDDGDGTHVIWHEVKTDQKGLDEYRLSSNGADFWEIAESYIEAQEKKGTGNFFVEYNGWYPKYKKFTIKHDDILDTPAKPDAHYMWYCLLVRQDAYLEMRMLVIKTSMENFISVAEAQKHKWPHVPLRCLWWVDDKEKTRLSETQFEAIEANAPGVREMLNYLDAVGAHKMGQTSVQAVKSDGGDAVLYDIPVILDGETHTDIFYDRVLI